VNKLDETLKSLEMWFYVIGISAMVVSVAQIIQIFKKNK